MVRAMPGPEVISDAVALACRAPSLHNSQPWHWVAESDRLHLYAEHRPVAPAADRSGRETILGCGVALDHLRVALAALGWDTTVDRWPDPDDPDLLATLQCSPLPAVDDAHRQRADAIRRRRTDRLPFAAPAAWPVLEQQLRARVDGDHVLLGVVADESREQLADASRLTEDIRRNDPSYQAELRWWTSPFELDQGVPASARLSASEASHVDLARSFPTTGYQERRPAISADHAKVVVLSTRDDTRPELIRCGEALSAILLDCTAAGMATCILTHITEVAPARELLRELSGQPGRPQLLIRVGRIPAAERHAPETPRHPVGEVLEFR